MWSVSNKKPQTGNAGPSKHTSSCRNDLLVGMLNMFILKLWLALKKQKTAKLGNNKCHRLYTCKWRQQSLVIREKSLLPEQLLEVVGCRWIKPITMSLKDKGTETLKNCISSNKTDSDCIRSLKTENTNGRHIKAHNEYDNPMYLKPFFVTL